MSGALDLILTVDAASAAVGTTTLDDNTFAALVTSANQSVIDYLNNDPRSQQWTELLNGNGDTVLALNHAPITGLTSITIDQVYAVDITQVIVDRWSLIWNYGCFRYGRKNIQVVYTAGYAASSPQMSAIQTGVLMTVKALIGAMDVDMNATGESYAGILSQSFWPTGPGAIPPAARGLLEPYVNHFVVQ